MLVGVGKWRQWQYGLVLLSVPLSFFGYMTFDVNARGGKLAPGIFAAIVAFVVNYVVKQSFRGCKKKDSSTVIDQVRRGKAR
jgi:hypothetical protein